MSTASGPVTVFLPTWNGGERLDEVLTAVRSQQTARRIVLRAVDSSSSDGTPRVLAKHGVEFESIAQSEFDHGATRGKAIMSSSTELVVLLTQDAKPFDGSWLEELLAPFDDPRVAGAWSRQVPRAACHPIQRANLEEHFASSERRVIEPLSLAHWDALSPAERLARVTFDDVSSCVRRSAVERTPFPRTPFGEDMLWARAALLAGHRLVYAGRSTVEHSHDLTLQELTSRVSHSYSLRRRVADERAFDSIVELARGMYYAARSNLRTALRASSVRAAAEALPIAYLQITSARAGSRSTTYQPPSTPQSL